MSDYFPCYRCHRCDRYHQQQPFGRWYDRNTIPDIPFVFPNYFSCPDVFTVYGGGGQFLHHRNQPLTTNLRFGTWGRGGAKAYFRFHGGIGGGCGGMAFRNTIENTAARPLQLFDAFNPVGFQNDMFRMIGPPFPPVEASSGGTGVFFPVYPKRTRAGKGTYVHGGRIDGQQRQYRPMKQEATTVSKASVVGGVSEKNERKEVEAIPIELLLPKEWTYDNY